jgi:hypothetical protein
MDTVAELTKTALLVPRTKVSETDKAYCTSSEVEELDN